MKWTSSSKLMRNELFAARVESALERAKNLLLAEAEALGMKTTKLEIARVLLWEAQSLFDKTARNKTGD
jgi:hypothetical protein